MPTVHQVCVIARFDDREAKFVQAERGGERERELLDILERVARPECERALELGGRA